jgi:mono/diheme cytochrome c family protein
MFRQNCAICHGPEAEGRTLADGRVIPNLRVGPHKYATDEQIYQHISEGGNGMVPFRGQLSDREIKMLVKFVQEKLRK